jgi:signal transduction histidine kinase
MFQRLHGREEHGGTGIGLAISKRVIERLGGRIWCEPRPGGGTVFRFTVPDSEEPS